METAALNRHLNIIAHGEGLISTAMHALEDANEARWLVHRIMLKAMTDMRLPATRRDLDNALNLALRARTA